jgi:hypothetical protein
MEPLVKEEEEVELPEQETTEQVVPDSVEMELIDDIPFEIIRPGKDGEPDQMEIIFE